MAKKLLNSENRIKDISFKVKSVDSVNYTVDGVFSAEVEDRQGEIVVQSGWDLVNYMKNPVVLWAHQADQPPIAKMLQIGVNGSTNQLEGKMQFAVKEYDFAATIFKLIEGKYQSAFSAGFINKRYEIDQENEKVYLVENELLEMSVVPVPANQLALAKSKGIDVTAYEKNVEAVQARDEEEESPVADDEEEVDEEEESAILESKAIETISKSNLETIKGAIATLNEVLKKAKVVESPPIKTQVKVGNGDRNKVSVRLINRAIKELLGVKKVL